MKKCSGFTVIELLFVIIMLTVGLGVAVVQVGKVKNASDDSHKKTAINAMYYSLEESFYKQHGYYPETLADDTLPTMDKVLLTDPKGKKIGDANSAYRYETQNCQEGKCKHFTLRAKLVNESDFVKESRNK